jgi:hypothetical protein
MLHGESRPTRCGPLARLQLFTQLLQNEESDLPVRVKQGISRQRLDPLLGHKKQRRP